MEENLLSHVINPLFPSSFLRGSSDHLQSKKKDLLKLFTRLFFYNNYQQTRSSYPDRNTSVLNTQLHGSEGGVKCGVSEISKITHTNFHGLFLNYDIIMIIEDAEFSCWYHFHSIPLSSKG